MREPPPSRPGQVANPATARWDLATSSHARGAAPVSVMLSGHISNPSAIAGSPVRTVFELAILDRQNRLFLRPACTVGVAATDSKVCDRAQEAGRIPEPIGSGIDPCLSGAQNGI